MVNPFTSGPIALYRNVPIMSQYYAPSQFIIDDIVLGNQTLVSTINDTNYVVGQTVRLHIPPGNGCRQLNGVQGNVIGFSIVTPGHEIEENINVDEIKNPEWASTFILNVLTDTQNKFPEETISIIPGSFSMRIGESIPQRTAYNDNGSGNLVYVSGAYTISSATIDYSTGNITFNFIVTPPSLTQTRYIFTALVVYTIPGDIAGMILNIDSSRNVDAFIESNISQSPTISAIGDVNSGEINANGNQRTGTGIPGAFINTSPN